MYEFPENITLDKIKESIEGSKEFVVAHRGDHIIVNYVVVTPDTFPPINVAGGSAKMREERAIRNALRRECRGIAFDLDGNCIRRPYHKFFNVNERPETQSKDIRFDDYEMIEKLDGSLIAPYFVGDRLIWGTKMGDTDVARPVYEFVKNNPRYESFVNVVNDIGCTAMFEWCSRQNRIIIDHPEDRLVLTGVRDISTGVYIRMNTIRENANDFNVEVVRAHHIENKDFDSIKTYIDEIPNHEGIVFRDKVGHMFKLKSEDYCRIHDIKGKIGKERNIVDMIVNEQIDDVKSQLFEEDRVVIEDYEKQYHNAVNAFVEDIHMKAKNRFRHFKNKKDYALSEAYKLDEKFLHRVVFMFFENQFDLNITSLYEYLIKGLIRISLNNNTKFGEMKQQVFPNISYRYTGFTS